MEYIISHLQPGPVSDGLLTKCIHQKKKGVGGDDREKWSELLITHSELTVPRY